MPNTYDVRCPKCRKLLARVDGWGICVEHRHAKAVFRQGSVECKRCYMLVSFQDPPKEAVLKRLS